MRLSLDDFQESGPWYFVSSSKQLWISILAHLMGLTFAFTRLNAEALIGFLASDVAFIQGRRLFQSHIIL